MLMETKFEFKSILWQASKEEKEGRKERTQFPLTPPAGWVLPQPCIYIMPAHGSHQIFLGKCHCFFTQTPNSIIWMTMSFGKHGGGFLKFGGDF
jgi:hypothetical protein